MNNSDILSWMEIDLQPTQTRPLDFWIKHSKAKDS